MAAIPPEPEAIDDLDWHDELWPTTSPPLSDQAPPDWKEVSGGFTPVASDPLPDLVSEQDRRDAADAAAQDGRVLEWIGGGQPTGLGTGVIERKEGEPPLIVVRFLSCDTSSVVIAWVDVATRAVVHVERAALDAFATEDEVRHAVSMASAALAGDLEPGMVGRGMPIEGTGPFAGRRLIDVRFVNPDQRLARWYARVDVCDDGVVEAGPV
jgi:hypothetical protein